MAGSGYGLWPLVALNTVLVAVFAASFFRPRSPHAGIDPAAIRHPFRLLARTGRAGRAATGPSGASGEA